VTESLKLAFADRNQYVADPKFTPNIPMREMLSKEYAAKRRALIDPTRAIEGEAPFGDPRAGAALSAGRQLAYAAPQAVPGHANPYDPDKELNLTTYLTVVDKDHNMVSLTSSLLSGFGSGLVPEGTGVMLNDRMKYFYLDPNDVNSLEPMKRVRQTINPALALKDGMPVVSFGTPGADTQPQTQLQFFLNFIEFGMTVQQALEQPTVISNSFRNSYHPHGRDAAHAHDVAGLRESGPGRAWPQTGCARRARCGLGKGHCHSPEDRRADGRRESDGRQLRDGLVARGARG